MKLILARHGETIENALGILQGHLQGKLSEQGIAHAKELAKKISNDLPDKIYSSDLTRAKDTTKIVVEQHPEIPVEFTEKLRERDIGEFTGKTKKELGKKDDKFLVTSLDTVNGETIQDLFNRAKDFVDFLYTKHAGDTILIIAHNGINKAIEAVVTYQKADDIHSIRNQQNDEVKEFDVLSSKARIIIVNENDEVIGYKERGTLELSDIYRVSALWVKNSKGEILLAQRAFTKSHNPGCWGPAVAGTVDEGENYLDNIQKETMEEIGITGIKFVNGPKLRRVESGGHNYFVQWYFATIDKPVGDFVIQKTEVETVRWFDEKELRISIVENPKDFLDNMEEYINMFK